MIDSTMKQPARHRRLMTGALAVAFAVGLAACSSGSPSSSGRAGSSNRHGSPNSSGTTTAPSGRSQSTATTIVIKSFSFSPNTLTVKPGAAVLVTNEDSVAHTVTSTTGAFDTGQINGGSAGQLTAPTTPGTYPYRCSDHQYMTGTLVVSSS